MKNNDDNRRETETIRLYTGEELDVDGDKWEPLSDARLKKVTCGRRDEIIRRKKKLIKRYVLLSMTLIALLAVMFTLVFESQMNVRRLSKQVEELEQDLLALQTSVTEPAEQEEKSDNIKSSAAAYGYVREGKKEIDESSVYYNFTYDDLWNIERVDDEVLSIVDGIAKVYYFTAGSSLQLMNRGANFAILAKMGEEAWQSIPAHLDTKTAAELDFLSFRMLDAYYYALNLINDGSAAEQLEEAGFSRELYQDCTEVELARFLGFMVELFDEKGVEYEWQTYNIMSIFS